MSSFIRVYTRLLNKHPYVVQTIQSGLLMGSGDFIAQTFIENKKRNQYDVLRTAQFVAVGGVIVGPALTTWYRFLANRFGTAGSTTVVVKKLLCDQLIFAPIFIGIILGSLGLLQGKPVNEIKNEIKGKYLDILLTNYLIWPAAITINFTFMPLNYQVLFTQIIALFWNSYLSWKSQESYTVTELK